MRGAVGAYPDLMPAYRGCQCVEEDADVSQMVSRVHGVRCVQDIAECLLFLDHTVEKWDYNWSPARQENISIIMHYTASSPWLPWLEGFLVILMTSP